MTVSLFDKHQATLNSAVEAIHTRGFWTPYPEMPSPKVYGETANDDGKAAVMAYVGKTFELNQPGVTGLASTEKSPYGVELNISYPVSSSQALIEAAVKAQTPWQKIGAKGRVGVCLEILDRLNKRSFEIAHSVMLTTGQAWMMSFQAGGPHAQDRGLEAVAYAWQAMKDVPETAIWEKPQGKNPPLRMQKHFEIVGRGVGVVIGCATFPTWNTYPGLFAALATGNPVIIKPHSNAILPAALTVQIARQVLTEQGLDPNLVTLAVFDKRSETQALVTNKAVKSIDFTGGNVFGDWLIANAKQARVYAELAGVNNVVIESTDNYKGMLKNIAMTLSLFSGQMCTTPQALLVPATGIETEAGHKSFDEVATDVAAAIEKFLADPAFAVQILGAIGSADCVSRIEDAPNHGKVLLASKAITHPDFANAVIRTPVLLQVDAEQRAEYMEERFGPISFIVKVPSAEQAIALSEEIVSNHGALTAGIYTTKPELQERMTEACLRSGVALSMNLTSGIFANQSAGFSDYHGTGANPAANASYTDLAFVAGRFVVLQRRYHIE